MYRETSWLFPVCLANIDGSSWMSCDCESVEDIDALLHKVQGWDFPASKLFSLIVN